MTARPLRSLLAASLLALAISACGIWANPGDDGSYDCGLKPLESSPAGLQIGIQKVRATLCAAEVEVEGRTYRVGGASWLHEEALKLTEYAPITRANTTVVEPIAYALADVDPVQFLMMWVDPVPGPGPARRWGTLWGDIPRVPASVCQYANPADAGYPADACPMATGRTYSAVMNTYCGLDQPVGPYGGDWWTVVDPPDPPAEDQPYPGMGFARDFGTIELVGSDRALYRSELGAELELRRLEPLAGMTPCPIPVG